jgi:hypothetical protein
MPPAAQQQVPQQGGAGGLAGVANILLNLPQILNQTHVGPAQHHEESAPAEPQQPHKRYKNQQWEKHKEQGDDN